MTSDIEPSWICVTNSSTPEYHVFSKPIRKSENDDREYRLIRLGNGLEAMVIQDAGAERAAACMNVAVGFLQDPDDMSGMAHFCEHLLFMGTELYPKENEFDDYVAKNGGYNNADTQSDSTIYHFNVFADSLSGALSRFASLFHCPIFDPSCTSREIIAVDSEFKRNLQNDAFRVSQVERHLSKQGHPWRKFENGTKESLIKAPCRMEAKGSFSCIPPPVDGSVSGSPSLIDIEDGTKLAEDSYIQEARRRVIEWWNNEYDANRMRLCVIGKESVEYLSDLISRLFSPIATRNLDPLPIMSVHPYRPDEMGTMLFVQTIIDTFRLDISFPIADQSPHWRHQPASLLTHLVGHEGPGSLFSNLKRKHWARWLDAGYYILGRGSAIFKVEVGLTHSGFVHHREINLAVHQYLSFLRSSGLPAWHQSEEHALRILDFRYSEKGDPQDYAIYLTRQLSFLTLPPRDQCISAPQLVETWDPEDPMKPGGGEKEVRDILSLLTAENSRSTLWAKKDDHERMSGKKTTWEHEPWYGTGYATERYDASFLRQANSAHVIPGIYLPLPNKFIPQRLDVAQQLVTLELEKQPQLIKETSLSSLWYKKVDRFRVPKSSATVLVCTPVANNSPRDRALTCLFAACVRDSLEEFAYDATLAGLFWSFWPSRLGFQFTLNGFNDKFLVLASRVLEKVRELEMNEDILCTRKQDLKRSLHNDSLEQPYELSEQLLYHVLHENYWRPMEVASEIDAITVEELQNHVARLLSQAHIRALVVGNMGETEANRLMEMSEKMLQSSPLPHSDIFIRALSPPAGSNVILTSLVSDLDQPNSALTYYIHLGSELNCRLRVISSLILQLLVEPTFNILRTREQLGYIVACSCWCTIGDSTRGIRIQVQSEHDPIYLEERVDSFLDEMKTKLERLSEEEVQATKATLEKSWTEKPVNLGEEKDFYWLPIESGYLNFLWRDENLAVLPTITEEDLSLFFNTYIHHASPDRAKLSIHMRSLKSSSANPSISFETPSANGLSSSSQVSKDPANIEPSAAEDVTASVLPEPTQKVAHAPAASDKFLTIIYNGKRLSDDADHRIVNDLFVKSEPPRPGET